MSKVPEITFLTSGDLSRQIVQLNFVKHFSVRFSGQARIRVLLNRRNKNGDMLSRNQDFAEFQTEPRDLTTVKTDFLILLGMFPRMLRMNGVMPANDGLRTFLDTVKEFSKNPRNVMLCDSRDCYMFNTTQYLLALGKRSYNSLDITGTLGIDECFSYRIGLTENAPKNRFVTITSPPESGSTRYLPMDFYEGLCERIKAEVRGIKVVHLKKKKDLPLRGADSVIEYESPEEISDTLGGAILHIDSNGPLVHLRHAMPSPTSAVVFGPEDYRVWGYDSNINAIPEDKGYFFAYMYPAWAIEPPKGTNPSIDTIDRDAFTNSIMEYLHSTE